MKIEERTGLRRRLGFEVEERNYNRKKKMKG
jgi:hypothetical protein